MELGQFWGSEIHYKIDGSYIYYPDFNENGNWGEYWGSCVGSYGIPGYKPYSGYIYTKLLKSVSSGNDSRNMPLPAGNSCMQNQAYRCIDFNMLRCTRFKIEPHELHDFAHYLLTWVAHVYSLQPFSMEILWTIVVCGVRWQKGLRKRPFSINTIMTIIAP